MIFSKSLTLLFPLLKNSIKCLFTPMSAGRQSEGRIPSRKCSPIEHDIRELKRCN